MCPEILRGVLVWFFLWERVANRYELAIRQRLGASLTEALSIDSRIYLVGDGPGDLRQGLSCRGPVLSWRPFF
ncbi:protein of unknown function [Pseudomonas mediterranea]